MTSIWVYVLSSFSLWGWCTRYEVLGNAKFHDTSVLNSLSAFQYIPVFYWICHVKMYVNSVPIMSNWVLRFAERCPCPFQLPWARWNEFSHCQLQGRRVASGLSRPAVYIFNSSHPLFIYCSSFNRSWKDGIAWVKLACFGNWTQALSHERRWP